MMVLDSLQTATDRTRLAQRTQFAFVTVFASTLEDNDLGHMLMAQRRFDAKEDFQVDLGAADSRRRAHGYPHSKEC